MIPINITYDDEQMTILKRKVAAKDVSSADLKQAFGLLIRRLILLYRVIQNKRVLQLK